MTALSTPRADQNSVISPPGAIASTSDVKNSMRGAFGLRGRLVTVGESAGAVRVGPSKDVGEGPPVAAATCVGRRVGVAFLPGVLDGEAVKVAVSVGNSVGITCTAVALQAEIKIRMSSKIPRSLFGRIVCVRCDRIVRMETVSFVYVGQHPL